MKKSFLITSSVLLFSFTVLILSVLRTATIKYNFKATSNFPSLSDDVRIRQLEAIEIPYGLPYPGSILPGHYLWSVKAARDRLWLFVTTDITRKGELNLLFADKRLAAAKILFMEGEYEMGTSTLTKAEKYLEEAASIEDIMRDKNMDTRHFTNILILSSLKHRQIIKEMIIMAPDDARANLVIIENYPRGIYGRKIHTLVDANGEVPIDPFNGL